MRWAGGLSVSGVTTNSNPAKVINLSLGGSTVDGVDTCSTAEQNAVAALLSAGVVVVAARVKESNKECYDAGGLIVQTHKGWRCVEAK